MTQSVNYKLAVTSTFLSKNNQCQQFTAAKKFI